MNWAETQPNIIGGINLPYLAKQGALVGCIWDSLALVVFIWKLDRNSWAQIIKLIWSSMLSYDDFPKYNFYTYLGVEVAIPAEGYQIVTYQP